MQVVGDNRAKEETRKERRQEVLRQRGRMPRGEGEVHPLAEAAEKVAETNRQGMPRHRREEGDILPEEPGHRLVERDIRPQGGRGQEHRQADLPDRRSARNQIERRSVGEATQKQQWYVLHI